MRIVIWNLNHWARTERQRRDAWAALGDLGADLALLQEVVPPKAAENVVYRPIGGRRMWGSAVAGITVPVSEVTHARGRYGKKPAELSGTFPGSVAVAEAGKGR